MEVLHYRFQPELKWLGLIAIGDLHVGDPAFREDIFDLVMRWIDQNRTWVRLVLNGDVLNAATKRSKSDIYQSRMSPQEELDWAVERLYPYRDIILCVNTGNHEERISREVGIDVSQELAERLGVPYSSSGAVLIVNFGKNEHGKPESYTIYVTHGTGSARRIGGKLNNLELQPLAVEAVDVYIWSHLHTPSYFGNRVFRVESRARKKLDRHRHHLISMSFLDYGYAERHGLVPSAFILPVVMLCGTAHGVAATFADVGILRHLSSSPVLTGAGQ
ncbi:MAG: hypothetical protein DIU55_007365 [Bacillota bacterium]